MEEIIAFLEWVDDHYFRMTKTGLWYALEDLDHKYPLTSESLFKKYFAASKK